MLRLLLWPLIVATKCLFYLLQLIRREHSASNLTQEEHQSGRLNAASPSEVHDSDLNVAQALPTDILTRIFALCARGLPSVRFPMRKRVGTPYQLTISHVCSTWREVALITHELWTEVRIDYPLGENELYKIWISRAGNCPVNLTIQLSPQDGDHTMDLEPDIIDAFWTVIKGLRVTQLGLEICANHLSQLSESVGDKLQDLERLDLLLHMPDSENTAVPLSLPDFVSRTGRVTFFMDTGDVGPLVQDLALPWTQITCLNLGSGVALSHCKTLLQQSPSVEYCSFIIESDDVGSEDEKKVTLPRMRSLTFYISGFGESFDSVISHFIFPNLINLSISLYSWSTDAYKAIKSQYNLHRLQTLYISLEPPIPNPMPSSTLLQDAPMLRGVIMKNVAFIDDETLHGVSIGDLGCSLTSLTLSCKHDQVNAVLDMVETRWNIVAKRLERGYSWREELPSLRDVRIFAENDSTQKGTITGECCTERVAQLENLGMHIQVWDVDPW